MTTKLTKEQRAAQRAREQAERHAKLEAELQATLDLVTAMFWSLERGDNLSNAQIAACYHDRVLGVLWYRVWDFAEYTSRRNRIHTIAHDDETSIFLEQHQARCSREAAAWRRNPGEPFNLSAHQEVYQQALKDGRVKPTGPAPTLGIGGLLSDVLSIRNASEARR